MPQRVSAGIVAYRVRNEALEVFLAHPGGPFFVHKDAGDWTIPKGEVEPGEGLLAAAIREFQEEIGLTAEAHSCAPEVRMGATLFGLLARAAITRFRRLSLTLCGLNSKSAP